MDGMTGKVLSQREVDNLLESLEIMLHRPMGLKDRDRLMEFIRQDDKKRDDNQTYIIRGRLQKLETINDIFARYLSDSLSDFLFKEIEFYPISIDTELFKQYMRSIPVPAFIFTLQCLPLNHPMFFYMDNRLVQLFIQIASGNRLEQPCSDLHRDITTLERKLLQPIAEIVKDSLISAWTSVIADFQVSRMESLFTPFQAETGFLNTPCVIVTFEAQIEDTFLGSFQVVIPFPPLEPIMPILRNQSTLRLMSCSDSEYIHILQDRFAKKLDWKQFLPTEQPYQSINNCVPQSLAAILSRESDYIIANVLSFINPEVSSSVLNEFPEETREDLLSKSKIINISQPVFLGIMDKHFSEKFIPSCSPINSDKDI